MEQLGELQNFASELQTRADVYTINLDTPEQAVQVRQMTNLTLPILRDENLAVVSQYDFAPKRGQPMGGMSGVAQMGFIIIDTQGIIRVQRVDLYFGEHVGQILEIIESLEAG